MKGVFCRLWVVISVLWIGVYAASQGPTDWTAFHCGPIEEIRWTDPDDHTALPGIYRVPKGGSVKHGERDSVVLDANGTPVEGTFACPISDRERAEVARDALARALGLPVGLLAAGLTIVWIWRGFRPRPERPRGTTRRQRLGDGPAA